MRSALLFVAEHHLESRSEKTRLVSVSWDERVLLYVMKSFHSFSLTLVSSPFHALEAADKKWTTCLVSTLVVRATHILSKRNKFLLIWKLLENPLLFLDRPWVFKNMISTQAMASVGRQWWGAKFMATIFFILGSRMTRASANAAKNVNSMLWRDFSNDYIAIVFC